mgnify:CR=1 FL=1
MKKVYEIMSIIGQIKHVILSKSVKNRKAKANKLISSLRKEINKSL